MLMPQLHFTDTSTTWSVAQISDADAAFSKEAIDLPACPDLVDGIPFVLGDDGTYDFQLNRFFRECPTMGVRSPNSVRAYAHDILTWLRFLDERREGTSFWKADRQDVIAFHRARRLAPGPDQISAASWNRAVAALEKVYGWSWEEGIMAVTPFSRATPVATRGAMPRYVQRRARSFREAAARQHNMRFIGMDRFSQFRDIGLRAHEPQGQAGSSWRGRNAERDALFAELLVATGMRLEEASILLPADLPRHDDPLLGDARSCLVVLPASICKGGKGREIRVPRRLLRRIDDYIAIERTITAGRWLERRGAEQIRQPLGVLGWQGNSVFVAGSGSRSTRRRLDAMRPDERARLIIIGADGNPAEPAALWLADSGQPMRPAAWEAAFLRADARCRGRGLDLHVTPHMLRHTFAVHMLSLLIQAQIGALMTKPDQHGAVYRRIIGDPLQKLQRLLGHSSITSTYIYLDSLEESRALVDAAALRWADDLDVSAP
jgi:site-specific recombinase XerD